MFVLGWLSLATLLPAQQSVHYLHQGVMPPGAIGRQQLQRGGPLPGYFQPVEIKAPAGASISLVVDNQFDQPQGNSRRAGFLIGAVYRLRVTGIRLAEGIEVFPTIEVIDRLYTPPGQERRFPIPIQLTEEDLKLAADGKFITRVIYLEDPRSALPARTDQQLQNWFEALPGQDPLAVADGLGRPVAVLRLGGRLPEQGFDPTFFYGSPPFIAIAAERIPTPQPLAPQAERKPRSASQQAPVKQKPPVEQPRPAVEEEPQSSAGEAVAEDTAQVTLLPPPPKAHSTSSAEKGLRL